MARATFNRTKDRMGCGIASRLAPARTRNATLL
jgi:hypothetical protein